MSTQLRIKSDWSNPWTTEKSSEESATPSGIYLKASPEVEGLGRLLDRVRQGWGTDEPSLDATFEPRHGRRLRDLEQEHQRLLAWGELLYQTGRALEPDSLRSEVERFTEALAAHEDAKGDLLQDALLTDIGIVD